MSLKCINDKGTRTYPRTGYSFVTEEFGAEDDPYGNGMWVYKKEK